MALNWLWKDKCGECIVEYDEPTINLGTGETTYKTNTLNLYEGNAFLIFIHEYEEDGRGMYKLWTFWGDKVHMKRRLGLDKKWDTYGKNMYQEGYSRIKKIRLNKAKCRHYKDIVTAMAQAFDQIEIEIFTEEGEE